MLKCYVDDSGSDAKADGIFLLAGYVMEESRWECFAELWDAQLKRDQKIDYLHMTDAESGEGQFQGISSIFRKRKVKDLALVIRECHPEAIACSMRWNDYSKVIKGKVQNDVSVNCSCAPTTRCHPEQREGSAFRI